MKTIYFLRHAKSSWKDADLSDIDRPLNKRGKLNAPMMGRHLRKLKVKPQLIISSPSKRTMTTALIIADKIGYEERNIKIDMHLYGANVAQIAQLVHHLDDNLKKVMIVGHNPAFTLIVDYFTGKPIDNLPTCGLVQIDFKAKTWKEIVPKAGSLELFEFPKKVEDLEKKKVKKEA
ncbi:histidine phosphatase family protein [Oscillatoria amoena NRMC-F 0135]|nr:histidine phosphatase family protein [Oscillatoria amoena NRMC-F 0135]